MIMSLFALFRVLLMAFSYWSIQQMNTRVDHEFKTSPSIVFQFATIFPIVILFAEATCYLVFRNRLFIRRFVRFHLWMTFVSSFLFPIIQFAGYVLIPLINPSDEVYAFQEFNRWGMIIGWFLFGIARLFFIAAMLRSVASFNEKESSTEPTGYLDDFSNLK